MKNGLTNTDVKDIVRDEISKFAQKELETKLTEILRSPTSKARKELVEIIKKAITSVHKFMYIRKDVWGNDVK